MLESIFGKFPDVIHMLREDHKLVNSLFEKYEKAEPKDKAGIAVTAMQELKVHAGLEEKVIYPAFREVFPDKKMLDEAVEEHHIVHVLLRELKALTPDHSTFDAKFTVLGELVKHHVDEEEREMFPKAEALDLNWDALYKQAQAVKKRLSKVTKQRSETQKAHAA